MVLGNPVKGLVDPPKGVTNYRLRTTALDSQVGRRNGTEVSTELMSHVFNPSTQETEEGTSL